MKNMDHHVCYFLLLVTCYLLLVVALPSLLSVVPLVWLVAVVILAVAVAAAVADSMLLSCFLTSLDVTVKLQCRSLQ